jgi:lambda repressor-like predicted transcriptional regulator
MKSRLSVVAIALSTLVAGHALAADTSTVGKTREQVKAELAEAIRTGDLIAAGEIGLRLNEINPSHYPKPAVAQQGKTREQVKAELAEAIRTGDLIAAGETGQRLNQLYPNRYPQPVLAQGQSHEDVRAGLVESRRANGG